MPTLESFLAEQQALVEDLEKRVAEAYWDSSLSGTEQDEKIAATLQAKLQTCYSSPDTLGFLKSCTIPADHDLRRQRQLLIDSFQAHQSSNEWIEEVTAREMEIESLFSNFRAKVAGRSVTDNDLKEILKTSNDSDLRKETWEASKQIGAAVSDKLLELVRMRNQEATRLGFTNFYSQQIALQELDETFLFDTLDQVSEKIAPYFLEYKAQLDCSLAGRFNLVTDDLAPWHYSNLFFQDVDDSDNFPLDSYFAGKDLTAIAVDFFTAIGFDITAILQASSLYEKPGKLQHAYCTAIGRGTHDVRVLCNIVPNAQWMGTLLHELGHAVYDDHIDDDLPFFLREYAHTMTTEAIAELMGRFVNDKAWLQRYAALSETDAIRGETALRSANRAHLLVFTQWVLVMAHFERELYRNPEQNLDKLWWDLVEKFQHLKRPEVVQKGSWAAKIHIATSPVYYHNYLLGEMTASQILKTLKSNVAADDFALISSPKVGEWLEEKIFRPGSRYSWNELLNRATGELLNPEHFIDELAN